MTDTSERTRRVEAIVAEHYQAVEAGEQRDWRLLLTAHPDVAQDIEAFFVGEKELLSLAKPLQFAPVNDAAPKSDSSPTHPSQEADTLPLPAPRKLGNYEILAEIARGGMGIVYRAKQQRPQRFVALKVLKCASAPSSEDLARFRMEADAAAKLDHPNIVPIYEVGEADGVPFFSMKLVEGGSLVHWHAIKPANDKDAHRQAARVMAAVARAVHHGHRHGILHRDIKPGNILVDTTAPEIIPYVTDFGLAKHLEADCALTQSGMIVGTPSYMAPEQTVTSKTVGPAADVYALGAVLYQLLTGRRPFDGDSPMSTVMMVQLERPVAPRNVVPSIPRDLETICLKCLEKSPRKRFESAEALAEDLDRFLCDEPILARPPGILERVFRWGRKHVSALSVVYVLLLAAVVLTTAWLHYRESMLDIESREDQLRRQQIQMKQSEDERNRNRGIK